MGSQCPAWPRDRDLLYDILTNYRRSGPGGRQGGRPFQNSAGSGPREIRQSARSTPGLTACPLEAEADVSSKQNKLKGLPSRQGVSTLPQGVPIWAAGDGRSPAGKQSGRFTSQVSKKRHGVREVGMLAHSPLSL